MELEFKKLHAGKKLAPWIETLCGRSGVYIIRALDGFAWQPGRVLYIGESHTGHLKRTLIRHFQKWKGPTAGNTFKADEVEIATIRVPAARAVALQNALILEHRPKLNIVGNPDADAGPAAPDVKEELYHG